MRLHLPSVRAFARDAAQALGILAAVAAVADYRAENARLRAEAARLTELADQLATANAELNRELDDAADTVADYWIAERVQENARVWMHDHGISESWLDMEVAE